MKAPSAIVHRRVRAALEPFLKYRDDWIEDPDIVRRLSAVVRRA